jgi:EAL domain-containing protein (putative c-di-GMP-specific phosphodiesterase class I)
MSPEEESPIPRVLVLDDDPLVLRSVERLLSHAGYAVVTASSIDDALAASRNDRFDAALVDHALGDDNGLTFLATMRDLQPSCARVLLTATTDPSLVIEALNRGEAVRVAQKPLGGPALLQVLEDAREAVQRVQLATTERLILERMEERQRFDETLGGGLLRMAVQPIVRLSGSTVEVVAYEALLRPVHPDWDRPVSVLAAAERLARVPDLGVIVARLAGDWLERLPLERGLFVNLHPIQLGQPDRLERDLAPLIPQAHRVTLEITERSRLQDIARWEDSIHMLARLGFGIAIDDLGSGWSSLTMLADLQPQYIKIDMSLVRGIDFEPRKRRLVHLVATFGEATGAHVIAEGVESSSEAAVLSDIGIRWMQGFHFGRPVLDLGRAA